MTVTAQVEVIIPTYNQAAYLREALLSVLAQDYASWHVTVVNNFSSDETRDVVHDFADTRISIIDFANNGVIAASRNLALRKSTTEFIAFLDSDDSWHPQKLGRCVERLQQGADLVCHAEKWMAPGFSRVVRYGPASRTDYRSLLLGGNCLSTSAVVGRTKMFKAVDGFSERSDFITAEDYDLWLRLTKQGYRFDFIDEVLGTFRIHSASASSSIARNSAAEMAVVRSHLDSQHFGRRVVRRRAGRSHYSAARAFHNAGDYSSATKRFFLSMRLAPLFPRTYVGLGLTMVSMLLKWGRTR